MRDNKLMYYNYPTETEYAKIVDAETGIVNHVEYNKFCAKREKAYVDYVVGLF